MYDFSFIQRQPASITASRGCGNDICHDPSLAIKLRPISITILDAAQPHLESAYNEATMSLVEQIQKDIIAAMKAKEERRLSALRMVKAALLNREKDKMAPLDDKEAQQILTTLIKQRKESVEQFTKGGRLEMAASEAAEIVLIETYLPQSASAEDVVAGVQSAIAEMTAAGVAPSIKEMGLVMKAAMARFASANVRVDGKLVSETVKRELEGG